MDYPELEYNETMTSYGASFSARIKGRAWGCIVRTEYREKGEILEEMVKCYNEKHHKQEVIQTDESN